MLSFRPVASLAVLVLLATNACSTGSNPVPANPPGSLPPCNPQAAVQLSYPLSGSQGNSNTPGHVQIVINATKNVIPTGWRVLLYDVYGNLAQGGFLTVAHNPTQFAPFQNNFYYNATAPTLFSNDIYKAYLNLTTSSCQPLLIGSFAT